MDEPLGNYAKWNQPVPKILALCDSTYMAFLKWSDSERRTGMLLARGGSRGRGVTDEWGQSFSSVGWQEFWRWTVVMAAPPYDCGQHTEDARKEVNVLDGVHTEKWAGRDPRKEQTPGKWQEAEEKAVGGSSAMNSSIRPPGYMTRRPETDRRIPEVSRTPRRRSLKSYMMGSTSLPP